MTTRQQIAAFILAPSLFVSCASIFPVLSASASADDADRQALSTARHHVRRFASVLRFPHPIAVLTLSDAEMPTVRRGENVFTAAAFAQRTSESDPGCTVTFSPAALRSLNSLAHETCHCALDYEVLQTTGYRWGTTLEEIRRREVAAATCAAWLTDLSASVDRERRAGQWPREFADYKPTESEDR